MSNVRTVVESRLRWRIMIGIGTDRDGAPIDKSWARETALNIANALDAYSITDGIGAWRGKQEPSLVIEYLGYERERDLVESVVAVITHHLNQEEVWVTEERVSLMRFYR